MPKMNKEFNSPLFGKTRDATDDERSQIKSFVDDTPVAVFQELNKNLNARGLCIMIDAVVNEN